MHVSKWSYWNWFVSISRKTSQLNDVICLLIFYLENQLTLITFFSFNLCNQNKALEISLHQNQNISIVLNAIINSVKTSALDMLLVTTMVKWISRAQCCGNINISLN